MDKVIEAEVKARTRKKVVIISFFILLLVVIAVWFLRKTFASTVTKSSITTAVVERGNVENTINATGEVLPEFEETITSPINAFVEKVMMDAGSKIKAGQSVLMLDKTASETEYEKLSFQLESKKNDINKLKLNLDKSYYDLQSNNDIKKLRINSLEADVENAKRLYKAGGGTREDVEKAELNLKVAQLEKQQLENEIKNKQQTMHVEMKEAEINASIQTSDLNALVHKLQMANIVASRDGVVTWVNKNIGTAIKEGDALVRIANLSSFKVQGSISDNYLDQLHNNMVAIIRINDAQLRGRVTNIQPSIKNGIVTFDIQLDENDNKQLRPNMKVDVFLVTASQNNVLRIANGPAFKSASTQDIFVVNNGMAEKRQVHTGATNFDYVEIKDNVKPGEVIITSDMSDFKNVNRVTIK